VLSFFFLFLHYLFLSFCFLFSVPFFCIYFLFMTFFLHFICVIFSICIYFPSSLLFPFAAVFPSLSLSPAYRWLSGLWWSHAAKVSVSVLTRTRCCGFEPSSWRALKTVAITTLLLFHYHAKVYNFRPLF